MALMRLLVVNWQDRENPQAGGAELHLHEIFGRIAQRGHEVTLLCSGWEGAAQRVGLDGIGVSFGAQRVTFLRYIELIINVKFGVMAFEAEEEFLLAPQNHCRRAQFRWR